MGVDIGWHCSVGHRTWWDLIQKFNIKTIKPDDQEEHDMGVDLICSVDFPELKEKLLKEKETNEYGYGGIGNFADQFLRSIEYCEQNNQHLQVSS